MEGISLHPGLTSVSFRPRLRYFHTVRRTAIPAVENDDLAQLLASVRWVIAAPSKASIKKTPWHLFAVALRCMGRRELAEEVLQEAFVRIWHNASRYDFNQPKPCCTTAKPSTTA
jgi:hypothetical protein